MDVETIYRLGDWNICTEINFEKILYNLDSRFKKENGQELIMVP